MGAGGVYPSHQGARATLKARRTTLMRILAVDDSDLILELLDGALRNMGYTDLEFADSGETALEAIDVSRRPFDCFLLDIQMPGIDGIELCRRIRSNPQYHRTPIVMLTSLRDKKHIDAAFNAGATDYVTKPFDVTELSTRIRIASMLVAEQQSVLEETFAVEAMKEATQSIFTFDLSSAVEIRDVTGVVSSLVLQNYILQLSRLRHFGIGAIGFQIENIDKLYYSASPTEFYYTLTDVAEAISNNLRSVNFLLAYFGNGSFVAVVPRLNNLQVDDLQSIINHTIEDMELAYDNGEPMNVRVDVGNQEHVGIFSGDVSDLLLKAMKSTHRIKPSRTAFAAVG